MSVSRQWQRRMMAAAGLVAFLIVPLLAVMPAQAFKPYTHAYSSDRALEDVVADGMVTIDGRDYAVDPRIVLALDTYPDFYRGGTIGPDGFPDLTYGQSVIHPEQTGEWMRYIFDAAWDAQTSPTYPTDAERLQILAFAYGYLTHAAGDMWAHTLVNNFALGVFPGVGEILTDADKAAMAIRHIIIEGYIGDATNGYDGNPDRTTLGDGDVSDDSTPAVSIDAPHNFVYNTLIDPNAPTPATGRGPVIDGFLTLRAALDDIVTAPDPQPLQDAIDSYDDTKDVFDEIAGDCDFGANTSGAVEIIADVAHDTIFCPIGLARLAITVFIDSVEAFANLVAGTLALLADAIKDAYIEAWIDDIDEGLKHWNELGLAVSRALFDPQAYRNTQNDACDGPGEDELIRINCENAIGVIDVLFHEADPFINDHLLSMAGLPDIVGDLRGALQALGDLFDIVTDAFGPLLNPIKGAIAEVQAAVKELVLEMIEEATGVDIELLKSFLTHPSYWINVTDISLDLPGLPPTVFTLFEEDDHEQLDAYLGLGANHHTGVFSIGNVESTQLTDDALFDETGFAAFRNTVTTNKLVLLDSSELNRALGDSLADQGILSNPASVVTYPAMSSNARSNIMFHALNNESAVVGDPWLTSIDSDHSWRANPLPIFCDVGSPDCDLPGIDPIERDPALNAGNGQFPIWESCVLRPAFRDLYTDWENGALNFPDLNDPPSADASDPNPPVSTLTVDGNVHIDGGTTFVGGGHTFTLGAADSVFATGSVNVEHRFYPDGTTPGAWQPLANGGTFAIPSNAGDGVWKIDFRSEDPCHTFVNESGTGADPLLPEAQQTLTFVLDTTAPVITITTPPAGSVFDTDDMSNIVYSITDGALGAGVQSDAVTFDGAAAVNGGLLDMYTLLNGTHTIHVTTVDNLGNGSDATRTFVVEASAGSLVSNLARAFREGTIRNRGTYLSLNAMVTAAAHAHNTGQHFVEWSYLRAFISDVKVRRGGAIEAATADRLIAWAEDILARRP